MKNTLTAVPFVGMAFILLSCSNSPALPKPEAARPEPTGVGVVGGPFENGEFMYIGLPSVVNAIDTSPAWYQKGGQKLLITGTIFRRDGKTPAPGVMLYYYHTDRNGLYADREGLDRRVVRHGYIRGWVKSDEQGRYAIYTSRPAPYPGSDLPAHIHPAVKEPEIDKEYYLDEFVFDDDKNLTADRRRRLENRGGSGILRVTSKGDLQIAGHDVILGLNIPNYPERPAAPVSGLEIGEDQPSFMPFHAAGPDKGSRACPVCKYGKYEGVLYFVGRNPDWADIEQWLVFLEKESMVRGKYLKAYFVYGNDKDYHPLKTRQQLAAMAASLTLKNVALTYVPSFHDEESEISFSKISPDVANTFILFRNGRIVDRYVDLRAVQENFSLIHGSLDRAREAFWD
ncbi:MAG: hypothetical protein U0U46_01990 [Saprospiraceae bacterium]|nr:hypothetical protein [Saprospiraceae bacterium]